MAFNWEGLVMVVITIAIIGVTFWFVFDVMTTISKNIDGDVERCQNNLTPIYLEENCSVILETNWSVVLKSTG